MFTSLPFHRDTKKEVRILIYPLRTISSMSFDSMILMICSSWALLLSAPRVPPWDRSGRARGLPALGGPDGRGEGEGAAVEAGAGAAGVAREGGEARLNSPGFADKAPPAVVAKAQGEVEEQRAALAAVEASLQGLGV